ncbi:PREDICTED: soluble guanylate cyclase 88E-like [Priapulus caudatus]|uniref:guanylate cyclase n=1 Tax=Priapulus caudatus TaxID=37621 RepID=A0ABM1DUN8_PRICU|nr:PREDICTED: soluble guanylate cyclase 88E-like [Priapulus caudatus]
MYGLLVQGIAEYLRTTLGEQKWEEIRKRAGVRQHSFTTHKVYSETVIPRICQATVELTGVNRDDLMESFGFYFVQFTGNYGYDRIQKVLGRNLRDFLNGLDNLHEYLRFSYPKLKPPSFLCQSESRHSMTLHYRSRRKGYVSYVKGQIKSIARAVYRQEVKIDVLKEEVSRERVDVVMELKFDNYSYVHPVDCVNTTLEKAMPVNSSTFFSVFPFHIVFNRMLVIQHAGIGLLSVLGMEQLDGHSVDEVFSIVRPLIDFNWDQIISYVNNVFELCTVQSVQGEDDDGYNLSELVTDAVGDTASNDSLRRSHGRKLHADTRTLTSRSSKSVGSSDDKLRIKGQMKFMPDWESIVFLGTPILSDLDAMLRKGLYINDLSMHDSSRDLVLAGTQQSAELKLALDQEQKKSRKLEASMMQLDAEMKRTDELLYQMIPKQVADRLRTGETAVATCEVFTNVTILFSDVVGFTKICSKITPMEVVSMLNAMYTKFDMLIEMHKVYKVRRASIHSGTVVAGVVGIKMPRYCLFGDTVNTASRMESNGEPMMVHISETTKNELQGINKYTIEHRGAIDVKGKGSMKTYWLARGTDGETFLHSAEHEMYAQMVKAAEAEAETRSLYSPSPSQRDE